MGDRQALSPIGQLHSMLEGGCRRKKEKQSKVMQLGGMGLEELPPLKRGGGRASLTEKMNRKAMQVFGGINSITKYLRWERSRQE